MARRKTTDTQDKVVLEDLNEITELQDLTEIGEDVTGLVDLDSTEVESIIENDPNIKSAELLEEKKKIEPKDDKCKNEAQPELAEIDLKKEKPTTSKTSLKKQEKNPSDAELKTNSQEKSVPQDEPSINRKSPGAKSVKPTYAQSKVNEVGQKSARIETESPIKETKKIEKPKINAKRSVRPLNAGPRQEHRSSVGIFKR